MPTTETMANAADRIEQARLAATCRHCRATRQQCNELFAGHTDPIGCCTGCDHQISGAALAGLATELRTGRVAPPRQRRRTTNWYRMLGQRATWIDAQGDRVEIAAMDATYRYNASRMLERKAARLSEAYVWGMVMDPLQPTSDHASDAYSQEIGDTEARIARDPVQFIRSTPLYRSLTAGLPRNPYKLWRLAQRARHWGHCEARRHNRAVCTCEPTR